MTTDTALDAGSHRYPYRRKADTQRSGDNLCRDARGRAALRRQAVDALALLGTPREARFDRLTRLACSIFDVAYASVAISADDSYWVSSSFADWCPVYTPDRRLFDSVIMADGPVAYSDTGANADWAGVPEIVDGRLRFFAGAPLHDANGVEIGAFCIGDRRRRELDDSVRYLFSEIAQWVRNQLRASQDASSGRRARLQLSPAVAPVIAGYEVAATSVSGSRTGADFYDWAGVADGVAFMLADVTGEPAEANIVSATLRAALRASIAAGSGRYGADFPRIADMVAKTAQLVRGDLDRAQKVATVFLATVNPETHRLTWVDAGHGLAVIARADDSHDWLGRGDLPLGISTGCRWNEHCTQLDPGDTLLIFSDGLLDRDGGICASLADVQGLLRGSPSPKDLVAKLVELTHVISPTDDTTVIALRRAEERCPRRAEGNSPRRAEERSPRRAEERSPRRAEAKSPRRAETELS